MAFYCLLMRFTFGMSILLSELSTVSQSHNAMLEGGPYSGKCILALSHFGKQRSLKPMINFLDAKHLYKAPC